jgi:hypothetical protein
MGLSQSDAIRQAIQDAALRLREPERLVAEMLAVISFKHQ